MNCIFFRKFEIEVFKFQLWLKNSDISMLAIISLNLIDGNVWAIPRLMPVNGTENDSQVRKYQHQYTIMTFFFLCQHLESVKQIVTFRLENKLIGLLIVFFCVTFHESISGLCYVIKQFGICSFNWFIYSVSIKSNGCNV